MENIPVFVLHLLYGWRMRWNLNSVGVDSFSTLRIWQGLHIQNPLSFKCASPEEFNGHSIIYLDALDVGLDLDYFTTPLGGFTAVEDYFGNVYSEAVNSEYVQDIG